MRKSAGFLLIFLLMVPVLIICGCETTKGFAAVGKGIAKDSASAWQGVKDADVWIKKNLW